MEKKLVKKPGLKRGPKKKVETTVPAKKTEHVKHEEKPAVAHKQPAKVTHGKNFYAVGRRKTAVAQILLSGGEGGITINKLPFEKYFMTEDLQRIAQQPLSVVGLNKDIQIKAKIHGGGIHAQAEALRHAVSRAVVAMDADSRRTLKKHGFLTRDPRVKERKKPGLKRARRAPQFSKR